MSKTSKTPEQAADTCPVCGHKDLIYGDSELQDESYIYDWTCPNCGQTREGMPCSGLLRAHSDLTTLYQPP